MEKEHNVSEADRTAPCLMEDTMKLMIEPVTAQPLSRTTPTYPCTHSRAIDEVLTRGKKRTGKVRCLECGVVFDDPYQGQQK
jgi:hypothetical protein